MSISQAIQSALSGLNATQTQAAIVSRNISNAQTEGYVRKDVELGSLVVGGSGAGVSVLSISRTVDEFLIRDVRTAASRVGYQETLSAALSLYTDLVGQPQDERSLASALGEFQRELALLGENPEDVALQQAVAAKARDLTGVFKHTDSAIRQLREDADAQISGTVLNINRDLSEIHRLNLEIQGRGRDGDIGDLLDQRDRLIDRLSQEIPINVLPSNNGVTILTNGGVTLLDSEVHPLSFAASPVIPPNAAYTPPPGPSALSGLTVDGVDIAPGSNYPGALSGGKLAAHFEIRDRLMPRFQRQVDELASQLTAAFQNADATVTGVAPSDTGFFTDAGAAHDPLAYAPGLAGRIAVNTLIDPLAGGDPSRIRDGAHAAVPGPAGDPAQIQAFSAVFTQTFGFDPAAGIQTSATLLNYASNASSDAHTLRSTAQNNAKSETIAFDSLSNSRLSKDGVNIDDEMQKMLSIERSYAASAQVISAANRMLDQLLASF